MSRFSNNGSSAESAETQDLAGLPEVVEIGNPAKNHEAAGLSDFGNAAVSEQTAGFGRNGNLAENPKTAVTP